MAVIILIISTVALLAILRLLARHRRWEKAFKTQTEAHTKLIDKIGSTPELISYLETEAGKTFLDPIPVNGAEESFQSSGTLNPISRILAPLQAGIVATIVGIGILIARTAIEDTGTLLLCGTLGVTLGIGLIISTGISWILARRFGLMPQNRQKNA